MSHAQYEERLAVYGDLDPVEREEVDRHLHACAPCAARLAEYRAMHRDLRSRPTSLPDERLREAFFAAVARAREQDRREGRWGSLRRATLALGDAAAWVGVAAVVGLLVLSLAITWPHLARQAWPAATAAPTSQWVTGATPTPTAEPDVAVAWLERLQDLCCPPWFARDGETYLTISDQGILRLHTLSGGLARELPVAVERPGDAMLPVGNAAWTPDGAAIVVTQGAPTGIPAPVYLVDPASGAARSLGETYAPWRLTFDARGRLVVATEAAFRALDLASGDPAELPGIAPGAPGVETELAFSPDGRYVAALEGQELAIVDLDTGQKTLVTTRIHPRWRAAMAWSGDGPQLAYATGERGAAPELWVVGAGGSGAQRLLTREGERDLGGAFAGLAWLPGTRYIVFEFVPWSNVATLQGEYQVVSAEGGPPKTLFANGLGLNLSPDGRLISFVRDLEGAEETGNWIAVLEYEPAAEPSTMTPVAPATATPAPSSTPAPVTPAPPGLPIAPVATGGEIDVDSWSPDGEWLAFWQAGEDAKPASMGPPMTLHFYHVRTGEECSYPETETTRGARAYLSTAWTADGQFGIWDGKAGKRVAPCRGSLKPAGETSPPPMPKAASPSPGGSYRVSTAYGWKDGALKAVSTFTDAATGRPAQVVEYNHGGGDSAVLPTGPGGEWVTDRLFLINYTLDRGPLLVDLGQGRIVEVGPELFGLKWDPPPAEGYRAEARAVAGAGQYHVALSAPRVRLYHSETGQVEEEDFPNTWGPAFSPDGRWLLMDARPRLPKVGTDLTYESRALWARPVDPAASPAHLVADGDYPARWSPDWTRVAMAGPGSFFGLPNVTSVYSFPEGTLLGSWATGEYLALPDAWSPDGKRLAMSGNVPGEWKCALFIVQP